MPTRCCGRSCAPAAAPATPQEVATLAAAISERHQLMVLLADGCWDVLPTHLKTGDIVDYVTRELQWVRDLLVRE